MIKNPGRRVFVKRSLALVSSLKLGACGGGGGNTTPVPSSTPVQPQLESPSFIFQPTDQIVDSGKTATFQALATGSEPLSYQWLRNGETISGATSVMYTTPQVSIGDDALFSVLATNGAGTLQSREARLTVTARATTADSVIITADATSLTVDSA